MEGNTIYRVKGFAALPGKPMRLVLHGVGRRFDSYFDRARRRDETAATRVVLIGADREALQAALMPLAASPAAPVSSAA